MDIQDLRKQIAFHDYRYYVIGKPTISDAEYNDIKSRFEAAQGTSHLGGPSGTVEHINPSLGIVKVSKEAAEEWSEGKSVEIVPKVDGVHLSLIYDNGKLESAATRGDGSYGKDLTRYADYIGGVPVRIQCKDRIEVKGELYIKDDESSSHASKVTAKINSGKHEGLCFVAYDETDEFDSIVVKSGVSKYGNRLPVEGRVYRISSIGDRNQSSVKTFDWCVAVLG